ncbi:MULTISPECIES: hypothetical protein [unclassified Undibacterium]|uniref:hypothetical protein n=1 Tax=unclassified Undibacterium TaxID=2630295 RepID=UPI002AC942B7|nr:MULTISPECIES: hypothetical protein [unclassified Undibacterium]MEB0137641.1 hypothetical protein [Undibacterium sp. CCC2.1]MEB0170642.1 hypothetical protein [Undibacterium sp. CCC1.1]MEB0174583.1 hypothetical protein [Undibacterium sp. CCC3.4]MEB0213620.1 hypothetical protein [Undibacterium sp. 5I2]WPX43789.1 hypothetical protein RHM61_00700 [Undibacterium sp. CCC3.4]
MSTTIEDRVILLLRDQSGELEPDKKKGVIDKIKSAIGSDAQQPQIGGHGFWERLGFFTGINSKRWRKVYARDQRITSDMFQALAQLFPDYAFWLSTGITDAANGHIAPYTAQIFPERIYETSYAAHQYFTHSLNLAQTLYKEAQVNTNDEKERMYAAERTRPLAHWWDSPLSDAAYKIASSEEYDYLKKLWNEREEERKENIERIAAQKQKPLVAQTTEKNSSNLRITPILGIDPRTQHQNRWDLFYRPKDLQKSKFALSILNIPLTQLTDEQFKSIAEMSLSDIQKYLEHHGINENLVFPVMQGGQIRYNEDKLTPNETERLEKLMIEHRKRNNGNQAK